VAVQTPAFNHKRWKSIFGNEVLEITRKATHGLLVTAQRSQILAVLLGQDVK
jgi:hypothetical protein